MSRYAFFLWIAFLGFAAYITLACGSSSQHQLQSITITPVIADAQSYPNGQVQFVASGHYPTAPTTVTPLSATWGVCYQFAPTTAISVSSQGLAQCAGGPAGTYTVWANDPLPAGGSGVYSCPAATACGGGCTLEATAQLTCP